jgi:valyl-tRNA synthetase
MSEDGSEETAKGYEPREVEARWAEEWEKAQVFRAEAGGDRPVFSMAIPPPNITGSLHMGHALTFSIEDLVTRYHRMRGFNTLWLPGTDHAGIATQTVVERELKKEGLDRQQLGREKFLERVWQWKEKSGGRIAVQMRSLGCSVDWSRERFTLDPRLSKAVRHVFVALFNDGLIYRAQRLINWCPGCLTAISDLEVDHQDRQGRLWQIGYRVEGSDEILPVATTRPETLLGDTGIAVHPDDERYRHLIGKRALVPLVNRWVPIVGDAILVNREFGTGVVKVTPGHDFNDFEAGRRNGLEVLSIFDERAKVNETGAPYQGLDRFAARKKILADLEAQGLLLKTEDHRLALATCQRSGDVVEPRLSWQWFVKIDPLAKPAIAAVEDGRIRFIPQSWTATYFHWMHNIHDWCISRQLWWGHQIPAWYCDCGEVMVSEETPRVCTRCGGSALRQDPDVLDTWFSSALWPYSTLGWPEETPDFKTFYPTTLMETGSDILFFWVARMIMMGLKFTGKPPFRDVYLHAIVRDGQGEKMSKTKGNVVDPLDVTEEYGADALRFSLLSQTAQGRDIKLSLERVASNRAFANKVWNAARFAAMHFGDLTAARRAEPRVAEAASTGAGATGIAERWIRSRLARATAEVSQAIAEYRFPQAALAVYAYVWNDVCDWYIELAKLPLQGTDEAARHSAQRALCDALDGALRLLHPFMPFVTEEIWQKLPRLAGDPRFLCLAPLPDDPGAKGLGASIDEDAEREMALLQSVVGAVRNLRGEINIGPGKRLLAIVRASSEMRDRLVTHRPAIQLLAQLSELRIEAPGAKLAKTAAKILADLEVLVPLEGLIDFEAERARLEKEIEKAGKDIELLGKKLDNPSFLERAPPEVITKDRARISELTSRIEELRGYQRVMGGAS